MMMNNDLSRPSSGWSRRDILTLLGAGLLAGCASSRADPQASTDDPARATAPTTKPPPHATISVDDGGPAVPDPVSGEVESVVVVGAGVAGLVAAQALMTAGIDVVVVEARDRIGGRIHTVELGDTPVDLGALWVHDGRRSPILDYLRFHSAELLSARIVDTVVGASFLDLESAEFPDDVARDGVLDALAAFEANAETLVAGRGNITLDAAIEQTATTASTVDRATLARLLSLFDGGNADDLGFVNFAEFYFTTAAEDDDKLIDGGYQRFVQPLSRHLDIRLASPVDTIINDGTTVTASGPGISLTASHVIVTIPIGALKTHDVSFQPALPDTKRQAIERIGFGSFEKVALEYPNAFWQTDGATDIVVATANDADGWPLILDMSAWYGYPVVIGLISGDQAQQIARNTLAANTADLHRTMAVIGGPDTPDPIASLSTSWADDPFSRGSYTNIARLSNSAEFLEDVASMAAPHGRVLWAGEGTHPISSTVDGAWLSGIREAKRLLQRSAVDIA